MRRIVRLLVGLALVAPACGGGGTAVTTTSPATTAPATTSPPTTAPATTSTTSLPTSTTTLPTSTTTTPPEIPFDDGFSQALEAGPNDWEDTFVDPGAVLFHDGRWHMFYNGIDRYPAHVKVGYATSDDGLSWTKQTDEPLFTTDVIPYAGVSAFMSAGAVLDDGTWALWFYTVDSANATVGVIGRLTAPDPTGPWTADQAPALSHGAAGEWDSTGLAHPSVARVGDGWWMWFDGNMGDTSQGDRSIGLATSSDGATWTKYDDVDTTTAPFAQSDPVLAPTPGEWDERRVYDPGVVMAGDRFVMTYFTRKPGTAQVLYEAGMATSADGVEWQKNRRDPFFTSRSVGFNGVFLSTLIADEDRLVLLFDAQRANGGGTSVFYRVDDVIPVG